MTDRFALVSVWDVAWALEVQGLGSRVLRSQELEGGVVVRVEASFRGSLKVSRSVWGFRA